MKKIRRDYPGKETAPISINQRTRLIPTSVSPSQRRIFQPVRTGLEALAAIKRSEIDNRGPLDDSDAQGVLEKMVKQSREAVDLYEQGGEPGRAKKEAAEIEILMRYLPEPLAESEVAAMIDEIIQATGAASVKDMGPVMSEIRARAAGRVDMKEASNQVRTRLQDSKPE